MSEADERRPAGEGVGPGPARHAAGTGPVGEPAGPYPYDDLDDEDSLLMPGPQAGWADPNAAVTGAPGMSLADRMAAAGDDASGQVPVPPVEQAYDAVPGPQSGMFAAMIIDEPELPVTQVAPMTAGQIPYPPGPMTPHQEVPQPVQGFGPGEYGAPQGVAEPYPAPAQGGPVQGGPVQGAPIQGVPAQGGPVQGDPVQGGPVQSAAVPEVHVPGVPAPLPAQAAPVVPPPAAPQFVAPQFVPATAQPVAGYGSEAPPAPERAPVEAGAEAASNVTQNATPSATPSLVPNPAGGPVPGAFAEQPGTGGGRLRQRVRAAQSADQPQPVQQAQSAQPVQQVRQTQESGQVQEPVAPQQPAQPVGGNPADTPPFPVAAAVPQRTTLPPRRQRRVGRGPVPQQTGPHSGAHPVGDAVNTGIPAQATPAQALPVVPPQATAPQPPAPAPVEPPPVAPVAERPAPPATPAQGVTAPAIPQPLPGVPPQPAHPRFVQAAPDAVVTALSGQTAPPPAAPTPAAGPIGSAEAAGSVPPGVADAPAQAVGPASAPESAPLVGSAPEQAVAEAGPSVVAARQENAAQENAEPPVAAEPVPPVAVVAPVVPEGSGGRRRKPETGSASAESGEHGATPVVEGPIGPVPPPEPVTAQVAEETPAASPTAEPAAPVADAVESPGAAASNAGSSATEVPADAAPVATAVPAKPVAAEAPSQGSIAAPTEPTTPVESGAAGVQPAGSQVEAGGVDVVAPEANAPEASGRSAAAAVVGEPDAEPAPAEPVASTASGEASAPVAQADSVTPTAPSGPSGPSVQPAPTAPAVSTGPTAPVEPAASVAQAVPVAPNAPTVAAWTEPAASVVPTGAEAASAESSAQGRGAEQSGEAPSVVEAVPVAAPAEQPAAGGAVEAVAEAAPVAVATGEASAEATAVTPADDASADSTPAALPNEAPVVGDPAGPTPAGPTTPSGAAEQVAEEIPAPQAAGEQQVPATAPEPVAGTTPTEAAPAAGPAPADPAGSTAADPAVPRTSDEGTAMQAPEPMPTAEPDRQPQPAAVAGTGEIPRIPPPPADPVGALPIAPAQGGAAQAGPAEGEPVQGGPAQAGPAEVVAAEATVPTGHTPTEPAGEASAGDTPATGGAATDGDVVREPVSATAVTVLLPATEPPVAADPAAAADGSAPAPAPAEEPTPEAVAAESATPDAGAPVETSTEGSTEESTEPEAAATPEQEQEQEPEPEVERGPAAPGYDDAAREAVHRVMRERRDVRAGFRPDPVPDDVLVRVLEAAHAAPSVGYSQPWDFVVIRSEETRVTVQELAQRQREAYATSLPKARAKQFLEIKVEAILETPVNIVVTVDSTRGGRHTLGRHTQPQMGPYSSALAVENLWLAARAEGLGVGWVSFFDERELATALGLPDHIDVVAYLCVGYVDAFPDEPELATSGWAKARPLSWVVHEETYGRRGLPGEEPVSLLDETLHSVRPLDAKALGAAWEHQRVMTKPPGSLGILETIGAQLSGLARTFPPPIPEPAAVAVFAADHGVHAQGVSPWPQEVTAQMVGNFLAGGAVVNAFAKQIGVEVCVVDVGVATELPQASGLLPRRIRPGTGDMTQGLAMTREEAVAAIEVGIETARDLVTAGNRGLLTGDMGIANTTASAALISVFTGMDVAEVTGRGTGIDDATHRRKIEVVKAALARHEPDPGDPIGVLAAVGGLEHAAIAGYIIGAAALRVPVVLDGVIAGAAALVAQAIAPEAIQACVAGHRSAEPGHAAALAKLSLRPLVELEMRLGEGTGAVLALPLVQSAVRVLHDVATFDSAGVSGKTD